MNKLATMNIFNELSNTCHTDRIDMPFIFPNMAPKSANQYWMYSDLANIFSDYIDACELTPNALITHIPNRQKSNLKQLAQIMSDNIKPITKYDARLSRLAAWAVLKQHPQLITGQIFMLNEGITFEDLYKESYSFSRLYWQQHMRALEKELNAEMHKYKTQTRITNLIAQDAYFASLSANEVKKGFGLPVHNYSDPLTNYMSTPALQERAAAYQYILENYV